EDSLLKWSGNTTTTYEAYFKNFWVNKLGGIEGYEKALQEGVVEPAAAAPAGGSYSNAKLGDAAAAIGNIKKGGAFELAIYQKVAIGTGAQANNPWLLELPDPISKNTWDNYLVVSPKFARDNWGLDLADRRQADGYEVHPEKQMMSIKV